MTECKHRAVIMDSVYTWQLHCYVTSISKWSLKSFHTSHCSLWLTSLFICITCLYSVQCSVQLVLLNKLSMWRLCRCRTVITHCVKLTSQRDQVFHSLIHFNTTELLQTTIWALGLTRTFNNGKVSNPNKSNLYNPCHPCHILLYFIGRFQEYRLRHQQNSTALNWSQILRAYMQAQNQFLAGITVAGWDPCLSAVKRCSKSVCSVELCGWNPTECASIVQSQVFYGHRLPSTVALILPWICCGAFVYVAWCNV